MGVEWIKLLDRQRERGVGLTPSFLIGALRQPPGSVVDVERSYIELRTLLESMRDEGTPDGKVVSIFECNNIHQPVAALSTAQCPGDPIHIPGQSSVNLFVWPWYVSPRPVDFEWVVNALWNHFSEHICSGRFSYRRSHHTFAQFDESDLNFIKIALGDGED